MLLHHSTEADGYCFCKAGAHLHVHDDLVAVVSREELLHVGSHTGVAAQGVQPSIGVHFQQDWHCGCVSLKGRGSVMMRVQPASTDLEVCRFSGDEAFDM